MTTGVPKWSDTRSKSHQMLTAIAILSNVCGHAFAGTLASIDLLRMAQSYVSPGRIIGGQDDLIENHPYMASLQIENSHFCGGTIINSTTILTAAHCAYGVLTNSRLDSKQLWARLGSTDRTQGGLIYRIERFKIHEEYNKYWSDAPTNDVALAILERPINFVGSIDNVTLVDQGEEIPAGTEATAVGWGRTSIDATELPFQLKSISLQILGTSDCSKRISKKFGYVSLFMTGYICTDTLNQRGSIFHGDSGGPLISDWAQVGINSFGYFSILRFDFHSFYTEVAAYRDWIDHGNVSTRFIFTISIFLLTSSSFLFILVAARCAYKYFSTRTSVQT